VNAAKRLTAEAAGIYLDSLDNRITKRNDKLLIQLRRNPACGSGSTLVPRAEKIQPHRKPGRPSVRHLRAREGHPSSSMERKSWPDVHEVLDRMAEVFRTAFAAARGRDTPVSAFGNIVNIGIGGSDLGPVMAYER